MISWLKKKKKKKKKQRKKKKKASLEKVPSLRSRFKVKIRSYQKWATNFNNYK